MMIKYRLSNILFIILFVLHRASSEKTTCVPAPHVKVQQGFLAGEVLETVTGDGCYYSFKGIPYARPPVGNLRFKAPQAPLPWEGVRNATEHGSVCPQSDFTGEVIPGNEDCLFLNVYTKDLNPSEPRTVMFFIHGGGFQSGSGNVENFGPDFLINYDVVLVTINYRLGVLGFLCMDTEEVSGNGGIKDQIMAMKWVKENIAQFGGDPNNVTIFGESAGGSSTALHVLSPMSKGLFQRAISMSGVPFCDWSNSFEPRRRAFTLGKVLGYDTKDPAKLLDFFQSLPAENFINTNCSVLSFEETNKNILKIYYFTPVVEIGQSQDKFLTKNAFDILKNGNVNQVDFMIGHTSLEAVFDVPNLESSLIKQYNRYDELFVPSRILYNTNSTKILELSDKIRHYYFGTKIINLDVMKEFVAFVSEYSLNYDISRFIELFPKLTNKIYTYRFSCISERNIYGSVGFQYGIYGAAHQDDLMYLFDAKQANLTIVKDGRSYEMVQQTCKLFTNFAKYGNPTPDQSLGVIWKEYNQETKYYMDINETLTLGQHLDKETLAFWNEIYDDAGVEH